MERYSIQLPPIMSTSGSISMVQGLVVKVLHNAHHISLNLHIQYIPFWIDPFKSSIGEGSPSKFSHGGFIEDKCAISIASNILRKGAAL